jgi:hypothetical protein
MSRSHFPAQDPRLTVVVGWDNPLATFFAQVCDPSIEDEDEACVLWLGTAPQVMPTVATPPTLLQRLALQILNGA